MNYLPKGYFHTKQNSYDSNKNPYEFTRSVLDYIVGSSYENSFDNKKEVLCIVIDMSAISIASSHV